MIEEFYISPALRKEDYRFKAVDALKIFLWQKTNSTHQTDNPLTAHYHIYTYDEYRRIFKEHPARHLDNRWYVTFRDKSQFDEAMKELRPTKKYTWEWKWQRLESGDIYGYEVTSRGDRRYSPYYQKLMYEGIEISAEEYWQRVIKPMPDKKGTAHQFWKDYCELHPGLLYELAIIGRNQPFTDMFDKFGGQNATYCDILNEYYNL